MFKRKQKIQCLEYEYLDLIGILSDELEELNKERNDPRLTQLLKISSSNRSYLPEDSKKELLKEWVNNNYCVARTKTNLDETKTDLINLLLLCLLGLCLGAIFLILINW